MFMNLIISLIISIFISHLNETTKMKGIDTEAENARLKAEIATLKNKNKNLSQKLEKSKIKKTQLQQELKKNDALIISLSKEQEQSLSNLSSDINILNLLSD